MRLFMTVLSLFVIESLSVTLEQSQWSCSDIDHNAECQDIMNERYGLTVADYHNMMPLHQLMMSDNLGCVRENKCPLHLPRVTGQEYECNNNSITVGVDFNGNNISYPCSNVNLLAFIPLIGLGSQVNASGNDIWGWTQYNQNDESIGYYALTCQTDGVSIVDITDPINPNVLAFIQSNITPIRHVNWRDLKVYGDYAYVVADTTSNFDDHGLQIFNIKNVIENAKKHQSYVGFQDIYNVTYGSPEYWNYTEFGGSHNLFINEETGYLYSIGTNTCGAGGLHVVDIRDPLHPKQAGCFAHANESSYVHDAQCVNYHGPDQRYQGHEICFAFTPRTGALTIINVMDKNEMVLLAEVAYEFTKYTHQGWITGNHEYVLLNDEMDETYFNLTQRTLIWDVKNLTNPYLLDIYDSNLTVVDHNEYIIDNERPSDSEEYQGFVFQSNYESGLRILNIDNISKGNLMEIAYFDNYIWKDGNNYTITDDHNNPNYRGSWSVYPYFKPNRNCKKHSDIIVLQSINTGLYVLRHNIGINDIFVVHDSDKSQFWTQNTIITFSVIAALVLLVILAIVVIYLLNSSKNNGADMALIEHHQMEKSEQNQMTAMGVTGDTYTK